MKKLYSLVIIIFLFIFCSACGILDIDPHITPEPTGEPTPLSTPTPYYPPGSVWLTCSEITVFEGDEFYFGVHVNTGERELCIYEIEISFDNTILEVMTGTGEIGIESWTEGFFNSVEIPAPGTIIIKGDGTECSGPDHDLYLVKIHFRALQAGSRKVGVKVNKLEDNASHNAGSPYGIEYEIIIDHPNSGWKCQEGDVRRTGFYPYASQGLNLNPFSYRWHTGGTGIAFLTGDVTGDEKLEIVSVTENRYLTILSQDGNTLYTTDLYPKRASVGILADVDLDGKNEIGISTSVNSQMECFFYEADGTQIKRLKKSSSPSTGGNDSAGFPCFYRNGKVLVVWYSGWAKYPRGISLFDYKTGTEEWYYCTGAVVVNPSIADIDQDGYYEITTSGDTPHNGADCNDTNDSQMYVIIVNQDGSRRVSRPFSPSQVEGHLEGWLYNRFLDFNNDGIMEILASEQHHGPNYPGMSRLHKVETSNGSVLDSCNVGENEFMTTGLYSDKIAIATRESRTVKVLDYRFNEIASNQVGTEGVPIYLTAINDVNGDGNNEFFIVSGNIFYLLDEALDVLWTYSYNVNNITGAIPTDLDCDGNNEIIMSTDSEIIVLGY